MAVNREANSLSVIRVKNARGNDIGTKIAEIGVGEEPRCVAVHPNDRVAYVTNGISGTVSVVSLARRRVLATIPVGTEPRGCALTPSGLLLYVANHTEGTVSIINTSSLTVVGTVNVGRNPTALAITNNGDDVDSDETVFVTQIFAELNPNFVDPVFDGNGEVRDLGKRGVVHAFPAVNVSPPITQIALAPIADSGFNASRTAFCPKAVDPQPHSLIFCPDPALPGTDPVNANNRQGVFPNQLLSALIRGNRLYLPNIGAQPEPPETASTNVQALVYRVDTNALAVVGDPKPEPADRRGDGCASPQPRQDVRQRHRGHRRQPRRRQVPDRQPGRQPGVARQTRSVVRPAGYPGRGATTSGLPHSDGQPAERGGHAQGWDTRLRQQRGEFFGDVHEC